MSKMIQCDSCKKMMYADARSKKGDFYELWINKSDNYHLCHLCYDAMMHNIFHKVFDDADQCYVDE